MNRFLIAILVLLTCAPLLAAEGFSSLEEQMTGKEYTAAGLDKLSPDELAALNGWIRRHSLATLDTPKGGAAAASAAEDNRGLKSEDKEKEDEEDKSDIQSRIVGTFSGWDGQTIFKLENGMIWIQADKDKFYIREVENPAVTISSGLFGSWHLSVDGHDSKCKVKRIQ